MNLLHCMNTCSGLHISIEVNIQLWPSQTCHEFIVSNTVMQSLTVTQSYLMTHYFFKVENYTCTPTSHYRHSPPMSMLQFRTRCIGASESTVTALIQSSKIFAWTVATSPVLLEDTSPSELIYTQLIWKLTQQISRVPWLLGCMGMIQTKQLPYSEVSTL